MLTAVPHLDHELRAILAATTEGAFVGGGDRRIVLWNKAATEIMGYTATEVVGRAWCDLFADLDEGGGPLCDPAFVMAQAELGPSVRAFDVRATTKAGCERWLHVTIFPVPVRNGPALVVHLFRDVTSTRQLVTRLRERLTGAANGNVATGRLTRREREVLRLTAQGLQTAVIAQRLHISRATVRNHIQNILWKLDAHNRLQAVAYAARHYLL